MSKQFSMCHGYIELGDYLVNCKHPEFQNYVISQLALQLMYFSANHTRFEHSLGVCQIGKMIRSQKHHQVIEITERKFN